MFITVIVLIVFFFYFGTGTIINNGINGRMKGNGWMGANNIAWTPIIYILIIIILIGLFIFRKKNKKLK